MTDPIDIKATDIPEYQKLYNEFWKHLVEKDDGTINLEAIKKELYDYRILMKNVYHVYFHITGGKLSKLNYPHQVITREADQYYSDICEGNV